MDVEVDLRSLNRKFVREFIKLYKANPCLWDMKHPSYKNRVLKRKAFEKLIEKCKMIDQTANRDFVSKKIGSLRSSFRKEWKKITNLMEQVENDASVEEIIRTPVSLWYFDSLLFTADRKAVEKYMKYRPDAGRDDCDQSDEEDVAISTIKVESQINSNDNPGKRPVTKKFIRDFITIYKENPCLWQVQAKDYNNKQKKKEAYAKLIIKAREVIPNADKEFVTKKIASLRGAFRKEWKRIKYAQQNGEDYSTTLWYYDLLLFTANKGSYNEQIQRADFNKGYKQEPELDLQEENTLWQQDDDNQDDDMSFDDESSAHDYKSINEKQESSDLMADPLGGYLDNNVKSAPHDDTVFVSSSHQSTSSQQDTIIPSQVGRYLVNNQQINSRMQQDEHDAFGVTVAAKLRKMDSVQRLYAEYIINQALYKGALYTLTEQSAIAEQPPEF